MKKGHTEWAFCFVFMLSEQIDQRLNYLERLCKETAATTSQHSMRSPQVDSAKYFELRTSSRSFALDILGTNHPATLALNEIDEIASTGNTRRIAGVINSIRTSLDSGWMKSIRGIISAEVFTDFMDMAKHLVDEGYKDASAVIIGSVLEGHLRKLCEANGIPITISKHGKDVHVNAERMNEDLTKKSVYLIGRKKSVTAWLDLRNDAAHGHYTKYSKEQVVVMHLGVQDFIAAV